ncbi:MAG: serine/threonine-protein phosphatase [Opitutae bacterium]|nr:serine/threonine-protein phosphatase [Opitutae bacterium]
MKLRSFALTDIGCYRQQNEDSYVCDDGLRLYAVADGIGGLPAGAAASRAALDAFEDWFVKRAKKPFDYAGALALANDAVFTLGRQLSPRHGIGTTLTLAHFADGAAHIVHVGDSAMFRLRDGELDVLTREHNLENEMRERAARGEPTYVLTENRAALTRCVGQPPPLEGDIDSHPIEAGDRYLLCTDGITRCITPHELTKHLTTGQTPESIARTLVGLARERGGLDNATAIVIFAE